MRKTLLVAALGGLLFSGCDMAKDSLRQVINEEKAHMADEMEQGLREGAKTVKDDVKDTVKGEKKKKDIDEDE